MKKKIKGTSERPRFYVFRSNKHIYAQIIDDISRKILISSSSITNELKLNSKSGSTCEISKKIGEHIAIKAIKQGINQVVFDRGNKVYHGRIKALADAVREQGINF